MYNYIRETMREVGAILDDQWNKMTQKKHSSLQKSKRRMKVSMLLFVVLSFFAWHRIASTLYPIRRCFGGSKGFHWDWVTWLWLLFMLHIINLIGIWGVCKFWHQIMSLAFVVLKLWWFFSLGGIVQPPKPGLSGRTSRCWKNSKIFFKSKRWRISHFSSPR